jgi:predicted deacetylase
MKLILEFDDFNPNPQVDCLAVARELIEKYPDIILNFFTVPVYEGIWLHYDTKWIEKVKKFIDSGNINLGVHGTHHNFLEYKNKTYIDAKLSLMESLHNFDRANLKVSKVFRGPYWGINEDCVKALIDLGYTHLYSHKEYTALNEKYADKIKIVYYNWNLKDEWPKLENPLDSNIVVAHGHTSKHAHLSCGNGIWECYNKICDFIDSQENIEFLRIDQYA